MIPSIYLWNPRRGCGNTRRDHSQSHMYTVLLCCDFLITIIFIAIPFSFFQEYTLKTVLLECKYNNLQYDIRISSIEVRPANASHLYKTYCKEIHPGTTPFSKAKGFRVFSSNLWCLSSLPQQKSFQKLAVKAWREASWQSYV